LALLQIHALYEYAQKSKLEEWKFQCRMHGIDPDKQEGHSTQSKATTSFQESPEVPLFRDPSEYEHLSKEEKDRITHQMMGAHRKWRQEAARTLGD